ncbi:hypothetical protein ALC152_01530 [Arcobacter sp. 15-2]|uniref:hypothetical protein n=1 Tax=Arcobacter sp. 15-2 TaxID=3374109 RepID=UPI00399C76E1
MQTIQVDLEDNIYQDMLNRGINVQEELNKLLKKTIYHKEHKIANDIIVGLEEVEQYKKGTINLSNASDLLSDLKSAD